MAVLSCQSAVALSAGLELELEQAVRNLPGYIVVGRIGRRRRRRDGRMRVSRIWFEVNARGGD